MCRSRGALGCSKINRNASLMESCTNVMPKIISNTLNNCLTHHTLEPFKKNIQELEQQLKQMLET